MFSRPLLSLTRWRPHVAATSPLQVESVSYSYLVIPIIIIISFYVHSIVHSDPISLCSHLKINILICPTLCIPIVHTHEVSVSDDGASRFT